MTGAELLAEILQGDLSDFCRVALDGCVLLTAEEAEKVRLVISSTIYQPPGWTGPSVWWEPSAKEALALLTPAGKEEA